MLWVSMPEGQQDLKRRAILLLKVNWEWRRRWWSNCCLRIKTETIVKTRIRNEYSKTNRIKFEIENWRWRWERWNLNVQNRYSLGEEIDYERHWGL